MRWLRPPRKSPKKSAAERGKFNPPQQFCKRLSIYFFRALFQAMTRAFRLLVLYRLSRCALHDIQDYIEEAGVYGPYVHKLNKGGLTDICATQRLRASEAAYSAGGAFAVRAHVGSFEQIAQKLNWLMALKTEEIYIEFETFKPPEPGDAPGYAHWRGELYLPIKVLRVLNGMGQKIG